jgi:cyclopropane fatty-acyl-phospholipid synthase-like methyltransferase
LTSDSNRNAPGAQPPARNPDARRWDNRYSVEEEAWLERKPRQLLIDHAQLLPNEGAALDAASGVSANGLFLARRGLKVIALDISEIALRMAVERARAEGLSLDAAVMDLSHPWLPPDYFDIIANFRFLERATFPVYRAALKPGGLLFFESFLKLDLQLPNPEYYLDSGELLSVFQDYEILHWEESKTPVGEHHPPRGTARLVARKPVGGETSL